MRHFLAASMFLAAAVAGADDHAVPAGQFADLKYKVEKGDKVMLAITPTPPQKADGLADGRLIFAGKAGVVYTVRGFIVNFKAERLVPVDDTVTFGGTFPPGPAPDPEPTPDPEPMPEPAASLKVILVYESSAAPTAAEAAILYGRQVEEYLTAKCDGGKTGWARRDKDTDPAADTTPLKAVWAAARPAVSRVPCVVISTGKGVYVEQPLPATPADLIRVLDKYREGR